MLIECRACVMEGTDVCDDCVVSFVISVDRRMELSDPEAAALGNLADAGLVPKLRLIRDEPVSDGSVSDEPPSEIEQTG